MSKQAKIFKSRLLLNNDELLKLGVIQTVNELKTYLLDNPYKIIVAIDEGIQVDEQSELSLFLALYSNEFEEEVLLYDLTNNTKGSLLSTDLESLVNGIFEYIDLGIVDRYPLALYLRSEVRTYDNL